MREITVKICAREIIPSPYPMAGRVFEDFVVRGFRNGKKSFGGIAHGPSCAAAWIVDFLSKPDSEGVGINVVHPLT